MQTSELPSGAMRMIPPSFIVALLRTAMTLPSAQERKMLHTVSSGWGFARPEIGKTCTSPVSLSQIAMNHSGGPDITIRHLFSDIGTMLRKENCVLSPGPASVSSEENSGRHAVFAGSSMSSVS